MAINDANKTDFLFKKLLRLGRTSSDKAYYEEGESTKVLVHQDDILVEEIPSTPPGATTSVVKCYTPGGDGRLLLTEDVTVAGSKAWKSDLTDWIPPSFGSGYFVKIFESDNSTEIPTTDASDWMFDYETGILTFQDTCPDPSGIYLEAYRYIGAVGISAPESNIVVETTEDITYYVRTTGDDDNDGLTVGTALLTIQAAIDKIPRIIAHTIVINVGAGTFAGMDITAFIFSHGGSLTIQGMLSSALDSGTSDGGSTTQCVDSLQTWTPNEWRGKLLLSNNEYRVVRNNTATAINVVGPFSETCSGKAYEIVEQDTVLNSTSVMGVGPVSIRNNAARTQDSIHLKDIKTSVGPVGIWADNGDGFALTRVHTTGAAYGWFFSVLTSEAAPYDCYVANSALYGIYATNSNMRGLRLYVYNNGDDGLWSYADTSGSGFDVNHLYTDSNTGSGVKFTDSSNVVVTTLFADGNNIGIEATNVNKLDLGTVTIENSTSHGIQLNECNPVDLDAGTIDGSGGYGIVLNAHAGANRESGSKLDATGTVTVSNNTSGGIIAKGHSVLALSDMGGTGNGTYGLTLESSSYAFITSATDITGSTGNCTINGGTTVLGWSTDFGSDGDKVVNLDNLCVIERKDS